MRKLLERIAAMFRAKPEPDFEADVPPPGVHHLTRVWGGKDKPPVVIGDWE